MKRTALPLRRTPLRKVSSKRSKELREYSKKRKAFLADRRACEVFLSASLVTRIAIFRDPFMSPRATDIHHKAGRTGWRLNDETQWLAVSREAHEWIHANPSEARRRGWLV